MVKGKRCVRGLVELSVLLFGFGGLNGVSSKSFKR